MSADEQIDLEVAIVGMAGRFPGAESVESFWRNLRDGVESIRDLSEAELRAAGVDEATLADPRFVRRAADLKDASLFDAGLFGFTPREAELTDPQLRLFLEDAWTALEDAGYLSDRQDVRVGVFAGASGSTYLLNNIATSPRADEAMGAFQTALGNERDYLATQLSYRLDLRGPSCVVQTACSTSLVAVHLACQSLLNGECDVAIAGGVSVSVPQTAGYVYEEGGIESPDGRCRAFDAAAAGCVKGNGSGVVVLRRLKDALREGDAIRAVIKGSAVNNDGSLKVGFTAPSEEGQAGVITEALSVAGVDASTISYVETHGTATALGDPVEIAALTRAFALPAGGAHRCALGSVKSNLGHLDAAAGVAGLIKTVLALEHRQIPPSLHWERPNPRIDLARTPFDINTELRPWISNGAPRRAGVSSFGIGGTNAHLILEERPEPAPAGGARPAQVLVLSAATEPALTAAAEALAARLESAPAPDLADTAFTLQVGRKRLAWRRAIVAHDAPEAVAALRGSLRSEAARHDERRGAEVAFLFPGQGSQRAGMARGLHREERAFREAFDLCAEILRPLLGLDLRDVIFARGAGREAADERLRETSLAQPALFAVEYALARLWISWGVRPSAMAGHSIGEYVAACLAGVISLPDALGLVAERGRLMAGLPPGAMLAVQLGESELAARLKERPALALAAINAPSWCVASGPTEEIDRLELELSAAGIGCRRLRTSHAFHSSMMDPIVGEFERRLRNVRLDPPSIPFLSNLSGTWISADQATDPAYWARHLRHPVRFGDNVAALAADPSRVLLEVGPGTSLSSLARLQAGPEMVLVASMPHPRPAVVEADEEATVLEAVLLEAVARLWCAGVDLDWTGFHEGNARRRVPLPTYPFQRERYWIEPGGRTGQSARSEASGKNPDLAEWFYVPGWKRSTPPRDVLRQEHHDLPAWLLFDDGSALGRAVAQLAASRGARVATVRAGKQFARGAGDSFTIDPRRKEQYEELLRSLISEDLLPGRIAHLWCAGGSRSDPEPAQDLGLFSLLFLAQAIGHVAGDVSDLRIAAVAASLFDIAGEPVVSPERATMVGVCRVVPQEYAGVTCRLVDPGDTGAPQAASWIAAELDAGDREPVVAWRGGHRWVPSFSRVRLERPVRDPEAVHPGGAFLVTGGMGPLEVALAKRLAEAGATGIGFLECDAPVARQVEELRALGRGSLEIFCAAARVTDAAAVAEAVSAARARFGRLDGIFHTAGAIGGGMIQLKERGAAERVLAPRLTGAPLLAGLLRDGELLVIFSSAISATGVFGQADYCAASAFLDALANARRHGPGPRVLAIDWATALWDRWQDASGPGSAALLAQLREMQSTIGITVDEGIDALWRALELGEPQVIVSPQEFDEIVAQSRSASVADFMEAIGGGRTGALQADREGREVVGPASDTERRVAAVWSGLLGIARIGRTDNFFDLGGNSLLAIQLASQLRKTFEIDLTIASLFESADLASLSAAVDRALDERRAAEEVGRLLDEIESLSADEIQAELAGAAGAAEAPEAVDAVRTE